MGEGFFYIVISKAERKLFDLKETFIEEEQEGGTNCKGSMGISFKLGDLTR